ncbi:MAG: protein arginine kinase [Candidatus Zixiibacteriota bacterium]|nr:MAG: protein arginine kinase [candidate division Zixibacteria bacterium]
MKSKDMFEDMARNLTDWLSGKGDESTVVISSRVRLARNVAGCVFPGAAGTDTRKKIIEYFESAVSRSDMLSRGTIVRSSDLSPLDRDFLVERHLMSPNFVAGDSSRALYIGEDERVSIMVNEEDHLRIQALAPGRDSDAPYKVAGEFDNEIGSYLEFDYDSDFGFLTACPTNVGTGMRASVLIHLPGLVITKEIDRVITKITKMGVAVRGFYGEGTDVLGNLFQVSNQNTLGVSEEDTMKLVMNVTDSIIKEEVHARELMMDEALEQIEDKIWRAYGILKFARVLTSEEVMNLLSALRLGVAMKIIDFVDIALINEILLLSQPAHLQKYYEEEMSSDRRDAVRAEMVREKLK